MKNQKNERGITLVALVVTIVVLLILAGITIMYVMGDNSVFSNAQKAGKDTEASAIREAVMVSINANVIPQLYIGTPATDNDYTEVFKKGLYSGMEMTAGTVTATSTETGSGEMTTTVTITNGKIKMNGKTYPVSYSNADGLDVGDPE